MLNINSISLEQLGKAFYLVNKTFALTTDTITKTATPHIEFRAPDTYITIIRGFILKSLTGQGYYYACPGFSINTGANYMSDLRIDNQSIFYSPTSMAYGKTLNHNIDMEKSNECIPVKPNSLVQLGIWDVTAPALAPVIIGDYYAELWGNFTTMKYQESLGGI